MGSFCIELNFFFGVLRTLDKIIIAWLSCFFLINNHQSNLHFLGTCKSNKNVLILKTHENTIKNFNDKNMINRRENQLIHSDKKLFDEQFLISF